MAMPADLPDHPLISVVMPVYNAESYVAEAIASILAQTYSHWELIVVDDGSTDGSAGIVREFVARDARIHPIFLEHGGAPRAQNAGIAATRGELIARLDHDDIALPERLAVQLAWMRQTGVDVCGSSIKRFGAEDGLLWAPESHLAFCYELLFRDAMLDTTLLARADILKTHPYNERAVFDDYELLTRLALVCQIGNVPQVLVKHRCHPQQVHRVQSARCRADMREFREPYFHALFPDATAEDYAALARVAEKESFADLADLERAGTWLVRLAQTPDRFLRRRMAERWQAACFRSAQLGLAIYRLYQQIAPEFGLARRPGARKVWLACALRLNADSRQYRWLKQIRDVARRNFASRGWRHAGGSSHDG
jgi:glycosyltransferase involved in cell wall biosynthesis